MSTTIDERVVKMEFDNKTFEKNVASTMKQLDSFNKQLNFDNVQTGFQKVENAAKAVSFQKIQDGVDMLTKRFSTMGIVAQTALQNITNSAVNAGKTLIKSMSVDGIAAGWEKFADKTSSVGTLVAQGYSLDEVNEQLKLLNWYTDETSYNFVDMVANIAKFTASGQSLPDSVTALMGIANWAALSGQNATKASMAMYQLSQAMSAGNMRWEDYRSIMNQSMDTAEFRQKALDAAVAVGTLRDNLDGTYTSLVNNQGAFTRNQFIDHLTEDAWFTTDVMMKVYNDYASAVTKIYDYVEETGVTASEAIEILGDEIDAFGLKAFNAGQEARTFRDVIDSVKDAVSTGWMNTYELIFGDYYEAKELWTDLANSLYDVFTASVAARNEQLEIWKALDGREYILQAFWKVWDGIGGAVTTVKEAFREMAPALSGEQMAEMSKQIYILVSAFTQLEGVTEKLARIGRGFGAAWKMVNDILYQIGYGTATGLFKILDALNIDILGLVATLADGLTQLYEWVNGGEVVISILDTITDVIAAVIRGVREFFASVGQTAPFQTLSVHLENLRLGLLEFVGNLADQKDEFVSYIRTLDGISLENIQKAFEKFQEVFLGSIGENAKSSFSAFVDGIKQGFNEVTAGLGRFGQSVKDGFGKVFDWIKHLAWDRIIPAAGFLGMVSLTRTMTDAMSDLIAMWRPFSKAILVIAESIANYFSAKAFNEKASAILKISAAIGILAVAISILSKSAENWKTLAIAAGTVIAITGALLGMVFVFNKFGGKEQLPGLLGMTVFFTALAGLVHIIDSASSYKNSLLTGVGILMALGVFMLLLQGLSSKYIKTIPQGTLFFLSLGVGVRAMVSALEALMGFNWGRGAGAIWGATAVLGALSVILVIVSGAARLGKGAPILSLIAAVIALRGLVGIVKGLSEQNYGAMMTGLKNMIPLFIAVGVLAAILKFTGKAMGSAGAAILATSTGILLLVPAISLLSMIPIGRLIKGGLAIAALVAVLNTIAVASASTGQYANKAAPTILATAAAVMVLSVAATGLSLLDTETLWSSVRAVDSMVAMMALLVSSLSAMPDNEDKKVTKVINSLTRALVVLSGSVAILATLDEAAVRNASMAMAAVIGAFSVLVVATSKFNISNETLKSLNQLVFVTGLLAVIVGAMGLFPNSDAIIPRVVSLSVLMLALAGAIRIISGTLISGMHLAAITVIGLIAGGLGIVLAVMSSWPDVNGLLPNALGLSVLLMALAGATKVFSLIPPIATGYAFLAMLGVVAAIVLAMWGIGYLYTNEHLNFRKSVLGVATLIGEFISTLGVALAQGAEAVTGILINVGENLSKFGEKVAPFIGSMKEIGGNSHTIEAAKGLIDVVLMMAASDFINGINKFLGFGQTDMEDFGSRMEALGEGMKNYATQVKGITDPDGMLETSIGIAQSLVTLEKSLPRQGGTLQTWLGEQNLGTFAEQIKALGTGLFNYATEISKIKDLGIVKKSAQAATALSDLNNKLPPQDGILQTFLGEQDLATWGASLNTLAQGMVDYVTTITQLDGTNYEAAIKDSVKAAEILLTLNEKLIPQEGVIDWFIGRQDLGDFGVSLRRLGNGFSKYYEEITQVKDWTLLRTSVLTLLDFVTIAARIPDDDAWSVRLEMALGSVSYLYKMLNENSTETIQGGLERLSLMLTGLKDLVEMEGDTDLLGLTRLLEAMGNTSIAAFFQAFTTSSDQYIAAGKEVGQNVLSGMNQAFTDPENVKYATGYIIDVVAAAKGAAYSEGEDVGLDFSDGYAQGIVDVVSKQKVEEAATAIGDLSIEALRAAIDSHSPAVEAILVGEDGGEGYAIGWVRSSRYAVNAATEVGEKSIDALDQEEEAKEAGRANSRNFFQGFLDGASKWVGAYKEGGLLGVMEHGKEVFFGDGTVEETVTQVVDTLTGGISSGFLNDNKIPAAAKSKADQIREIFADALSDLSSDISTTDLEYKLWQALNPNASAQATSDLETQVLLNKIQAQTERVNLTNEQYHKALAELGADDKDTKEMYQTYLKEMTTLAELTTSLKTANQGVIDNINATRNAYYKYLADTVEIERMGLFTHEELVRAAQSATGYDPNMTADAMTSKVTEALNTAYGSLQVTYQTLATDAISTVNTDAAYAGVSAAYSAATGMEEGAPYVEQAGMDISESALSGLSAGQSGFYDQGVADANSYAAGLSSAEAMSAINGATSGWGVGGYSGGYGGYGGSGGTNTLYYDFIGVMQDWTDKRAEEDAAEIAKINQTIRDAFDKASEDWMAQPGASESMSPFYNSFEEFSAAVKNNRYAWDGGITSIEGSIIEVLDDYARLGRPDWESDRYRRQNIHRTGWDAERGLNTTETVMDWQYEYSDGLQKVITSVGGTTKSMDEVQQVADWAAKRGYTLASSFDRASEAAAAFEARMKQQQSSITGGAGASGTNTIVVNQTNYGNGATIKERQKQANAIGRMVDLGGETVDQMRARLARNVYLRPSLR